MKPDSFDIIYHHGVPLHWLVYAVWDEGKWLVGAHFSKAKAEEKIETEYKNYTSCPPGIYC